MPAAPKLVVIIPALNEQETVGEVIRGIPRFMSGIREAEVIVVDDGSTDKTALKAEQAGAGVIHHPKSMGVGAAFHTGLHQALERGADIIVNIDGDGQFNPQDIPRLIEPILKQEAWFVTCTRFADPKLIPRMTPLKRWGNKWMTGLINFLTGKKLTDVSCGFRAYTREAALRLVLFGHFTYTQESFIDLAEKDIPMAEVPLKVRGQRKHGKSRVAGSLWRYGIKAASIIFRAARDYHPLTFFGLPGAVVFSLGVAAAVFLLIHWIGTGHTYPYRSLVQVSGTLIIVGVLLEFLAMLADMQHRNRLLIERMMYLVRKRTYDDAASKNNSG